MCIPNNAEESRPTFGNRVNIPLALIHAFPPFVDHVPTFTILIVFVGMFALLVGCCSLPPF
jgi:hypothetical protein